MNITIGETIKRLRNQKGVTQEKLPSFSSCREFFVTNMSYGPTQEKEEIEDCIMTLALHTLNTLRDYVAWLTGIRSRKE